MLIGTVIGIVSGAVVAVSVTVLVKPLRRVAWEGITGLVHMKAGKRVDVVSVQASITITVDIYRQSTFIRAPIGEDREARRCVIARILKVREPIAIAVSLAL